MERVGILGLQEKSESDSRVEILETSLKKVEKKVKCSGNAWKMENLVPSSKNVVENVKDIKAEGVLETDQENVSQELEYLTVQGFQTSLKKVEKRWCSGNAQKMLNSGPSAKKEIQKEL